jgi:FkbM family methyltransferase
MNILKKIRRRRRSLAPVSSKTRAGPRLSELLKLFDVDVVIDVGANVGQFATKLRRQDFTGVIFSIEPLSSAHAQLCAAAQGDPLWEVAPRMATGERDGEVEINVSENSVSSSLRPWHEALPFLRRDDDSDTARQLRYVSRERVPIRRLSTVYRDHELARYSKVFVKMDVQGYERDVLDGASDIISDIAGFHIEMPTTCMYQGQDLADALMCRMYSTGFELWDLTAGFRHPDNGRLLDFDGTFFRKEAAC